jgi:hypothetical protein
MQPLRMMLVAVLFLFPVTARAQSSVDPGPGVDRNTDPPQLLAAQQPQAESTVPGPPGNITVQVRGRARLDGPGPVGLEPLDGHEFGPGGAWWKNSDIVSKLQLSDEQVKKISQTFLDHKLKLIDLQADLEKQELRLQPLLDIDMPNQTLVGAQIDSITGARGRLEKENAMMMLDIRRWLSVEQWKKLKALEPPDPGPGNVVFFRQGNVRGAARVGPDGPPPPPLPDDMPVIKDR